MASHSRGRMPRRSPAQMPEPTQAEDEIFGSVESDELYIDPVILDSFSVPNPIGALYPDIRRRNPRVVSDMKPTSPSRKWRKILSILVVLVTVVTAVLILGLNPTVKRENELDRVAKILPIDIDSIKIDPADPKAYVSIVLENLPVILLFSYAQSSSVLPGLLFDIELLQKWLEHGQKHTISSRTRVLDVLHQLRKSQNNIQRILRVRAQYFDFKSLQDVNRAVDFDHTRGNRWRDVYEITDELLAAMKMLTEEFSHGLGNDRTKMQIRQLLERSPEKQETFDKAVIEAGNELKQKYEHKEADRATEDKKTGEEDRINLSICKKEFVDSIYERLETVVAEMNRKKAPLGNVKNILEAIVGNRGKGLTSMYGRSDTTPMLRNWMRIMEGEETQSVKKRAEVVEACGVDWVRDKRNMSMKRWMELVWSCWDRFQSRG